MIDSPLCIFCKREFESIEHLFFYCNVTKTFWEAFFLLLVIVTLTHNPSHAIIDILFGIGDDFITLNHLILTAKF